MDPLRSSVGAPALAPAGSWRGRNLAGVALIALLALLLVGSGVTYLAVPDTGGAGGDAARSLLPAAMVPGGSATATLPASPGAALAQTPGTFWSIDAQTRCSTCLETNASVRAFLNQTPFSWVRYGQGTDSCNETTNTAYTSSGVVSRGCGFNVTALKAWCVSQVTPCHAILSLPGENNNSLEDAAIAKWIVSTVGFQPDFWSIGNEPTGWTHYGIPWTNWTSADASPATPLAYALDVKAAIAAVSAVDPGAKFIGLEAACSCNTAWLQDVASIDGASISAMAYHSYPSTGSTTPTLAQFYAPLASSSNLTGSYASVRAAITGRCGSCATLPIFVNEYNAGPGWAPSTQAGTYANAVFLAASVTQALRANVTQLTTYNLQTDSKSSFGFSFMNGNGVVGPTGAVFAQLLSHLAMGTVRAGTVSSGATGVWSVVTQNATAESLLVVSTNLTRSISLPATGTFLGGLAGTSYQWSPALGAPNVSRGTVAASYTLPAQGILLVTVHLAGPSAVYDLWPAWLPRGVIWPAAVSSAPLGVVVPAFGPGHRRGQGLPHRVPHRLGPSRGRHRSPFGTPRTPLRG